MSEIEEAPKPEIVPLTVDLRQSVKLPDHPFAPPTDASPHWSQIMGSLQSIREKLMLAAIVQALKQGELLIAPEVDEAVRERFKPVLIGLLNAFHEITGVAWDKVQWNA